MENRKLEEIEKDLSSGLTLIALMVFVILIVLLVALYHFW